MNNEPYVKVFSSGINRVAKTIWENASKNGLHTRGNLASACVQLEMIRERGGPSFTFDVLGNKISTTYDPGGRNVFAPSDVISWTNRQGVFPLAFDVGGYTYTPQLIVRSAQDIIHHFREL
jgi:hypothetical protein